ncbi:BC10 family protein [Synechococcus sp. CS-601]|nr:BC10 family protein [Synechococcus sp. CS-603]MCT0245516.1 BC10 family protein [Synechococcus sp. CS-601]
MFFSRDELQRIQDAALMHRNISMLFCQFTETRPRCHCSIPAMLLIESVCSIWWRLCLLISTASK